MATAPKPASPAPKAAAPKPAAAPPKPADAKKDEKVDPKVDDEAEGADAQVDETTDEQAAAAADGDPNAPQVNPPAPAEDKPQPAKMVAPGAPLEPAAAFPNEPTVTMISPRQFYLLLDDLRRVIIKEGAQEIPERLKDHPYLRDHGVKLYAAKA